MPIQHKILENLIRSAFPHAEFVLTDTAGDSDHYDLQITTPEFADLTKIKQHQLIYSALKEFMGGELHALSIKTYIK